MIAPVPTLAAVRWCASQAMIANSDQRPGEGRFWTVRGLSLDAVRNTLPPIPAFPGKETGR